MRSSAGCLAVLFAILGVFCLPHKSLACGWWGDGEVSIGSSDSDYFRPRIDSQLADPEDMLRLSRAFRTGDDIEKNNDLAMTWARRAAAAGHAGAMNDLGYMYEIGFASDINKEAAVFWFEKAAALGIVAAQHSLSTMLRSGLGTEVDLSLADQWLRKAAEQEHASAAGELASLIWAKEIAPQFPDEACFWWLIAIKAGLESSAERCLKKSPGLTDAEFQDLQRAATSHEAPRNNP